MKNATYIAEITTQKAEKYLCDRRKQGSTCLLACSFCINLEIFCMSLLKSVCRFWPIKPRDLSHVVLVAPIFQGIVYHSC